MLHLSKITLCPDSHTNICTQLDGHTQHMQVIKELSTYKDKHAIQMQVKKSKNEIWYLLIDQYFEMKNEMILHILATILCSSCCLAWRVSCTLMPVMALAAFVTQFLNLPKKVVTSGVSTCQKHKKIEEVGLYKSAGRIIWTNLSAMGFVQMEQHVVLSST